ncbi:hypothetical protein [Parasutterella excrementihominis]|uniref:hypothetical protein n=1 Tax=Parasutterella excrementihominis TaxID=487175 RepID=UPI003AF0ED2D
MNYHNDVIRNFIAQDALIREQKKKDCEAQEDKNSSAEDEEIETPSSSFMFVTKVNRLESKEE